MINYFNKNIFYLIFLMIIVLLGISFLTLLIGSEGWSLVDFKNETIFNYRFNRLLLAIIAGSSLAASGASLQALFRNQLADPHIFGISGGAALGASIVFCFFSHSIFLSPRLGAMCGSLVAFLLILYFMRGLHQALISHCLLLGVFINSLAGAFITLLKTLMSAEKTKSLLFWLTGYLSVIESQEFLIIIPLWLLGLFILLKFAHKLEILAFGSTEAELLGINAKVLSKYIIIANCILIGNIISFTGVIAFLGLIIPHLVRMFNVYSYRFLLPLSMLAGAITLVFFDGLSRLSFMFFATEISSGVLSSLLLSPLFFILLLKARSYDNVNN